MKKKVVTLAVAVVMATTLAVSLTACKPSVPEGFTPVVYQCTGLSRANQNVFKEMVDTYNSTQGQTDKVFVDAKYVTGDYNYDTDLNSSSVKYSVANVNALQMRELMTATAKGGFINLDPLLTDEVKTQFGYGNIPNDLVNCFRINSQTGENGKYLVGEGASLLGVPYGINPHVLFYNTKIFDNWGIYTVSVAEDELAKFNTDNGASLAPHGYAEYKENPLPNANPALSKTKNERGQDVYKVFNNRIAMSWQEQRLLARFFKNGNSSYKGFEYGYMSEWWYNYCWSVGGDCINWDFSENNYKFSLDYKTPNYLATEAVEINGNKYAQGDVLYGEDSVWLSKNSAELAKVVSKLQELPSTYEAFLEFNRMGIPTNKQADNGYYGYGVAPDTTKERTKRFMTGNNCPLLVEAYDEGVQTFAASAVKNSWDIAPTCQYRLFDNEGVYYNGEKSFQNEYLMVIGESYDLDGDGTAEKYTGEVKTTANGTKIVGEVGDAIEDAYGLCIPKNAPEGTQEAAIKFISWVAGKEGQKFIGKTNTLVPANTEYALSAEYNDDSARICNTYAAGLIATNAYVGDHHYFQSRLWIDAWSDMLNDDVRRGEKTLKEFIDAKLTTANNNLAGMNIRIKGR